MEIWILLLIKFYLKYFRVNIWQKKIQLRNLDDYDEVFEDLTNNPSSNLILGGSLRILNFAGNKVFKFLNF